VLLKLLLILGPPLPKRPRPRRQASDDGERPTPIGL
jgi:hypothetical protein